MELTSAEYKQYSRHLLLDEIGESGQFKLKKAKVLVIGAGGLGCPLLQYISAAGVGTIGIVDHDCIEQSNLQRQILFGHEAIGKNKAVTAVSKLSQLNPFVNYKAYPERLSNENALHLFSEYDIIADGTDNFPTRYLINDASVLTNKPVVSGSIFKFEGQVSVFNYQNGPTYRCLYPNPPQANSIPNCSEIGVLGVLPGIIGALQANEILKIICNIGEVLAGKLLTFNALNMQQIILSIHKNKTIHITTLEKNYASFCNISSDEEISFKEFQNQSNRYNLLDVRNLEEHQQYNIGGLHIPLDELANRQTEIPQNKNLLVYCKSGIRSKKAIKLLKDFGFEKGLTNLKGGIINI